MIHKHLRHLKNMKLLPRQGICTCIYCVNFFFFFFFFTFFYSVLLLLRRTSKSISIHIITYFNDKSGEELFTLNSCRRDNMEKRERERPVRMHARTHTHTHTRTHTHAHTHTYTHTHTHALTHWIGKSGEDARVS